MRNVELNSNRSFLNKVHCELQELIHKITLLQKQRPLVIVEHLFGEKLFMA